MSKGKSPSEILRPMATYPLQSHLGRGLHTLGLLGWILEQTGPADVYVSTFSTSDAFLRGFHNLRKKELVQKSVLLADLKASKKTYRLYKEMQVTVISSQNQTYGDRAECTLVTTAQEVFYQQYSGFRDLVDNNSIQLNGLFQRLTDQNTRPLQSFDAPTGDFSIIGY